MRRHLNMGWCTRRGAARAAITAATFVAFCGGAAGSAVYAAVASTTTAAAAVAGTAAYTALSTHTFNLAFVFNSPSREHNPGNEMWLAKHQLDAKLQLVLI